MCNWTGEIFGESQKILRRFFGFFGGAFLVFFCLFSGTTFLVLFFVFFGTLFFWCLFSGALFSPFFCVLGGGLFRGGGGGAFFGAFFLGGPFFVVPRGGLSLSPFLGGAIFLGGGGGAFLGRFLGAFILPFLCFLAFFGTLFLGGVAFFSEAFCSYCLYVGATGPCGPFQGKEPRSAS